MAIDWTKPCELTDGRKVRVLASDVKHEKYSVVCAVDSGEWEEVRTYTADGKFRFGDDGPSIRNVPESGVRYVNVYAKHKSYYGPCVHESRPQADAAEAQEGRIACVRVEYTEGQMDS